MKKEVEVIGAELMENGWDSIWHPDVNCWYVGVWTGPDVDLLCVRYCETAAEAEASLSPEGGSITEAIRLAKEKASVTQRSETLGRRLLRRLTVLLAVTASLSAQDLNDQIRFVRVFSGITTAQASAVMPQVGQGNHMIMVHFPKAVATTSPIQVRIEAAYTCPAPPLCTSSTWVPISADITSVPLAGSVVYALTGANGVFPAIRVNSLTVTPGASPMDVWYVGSPFPISSFTFTGNRWIPAAVPPQLDKATFVICNGSPCAVGTNLTNEYIVVGNYSLTTCYACAKTAPTGAALIIDVNRTAVGGAVGTGVTIFSLAAKLTIPIAATCSAITTTTDFAITAVVPLERLTVDIDQIGSTVAGQDVTVVCSMSATQ